MKFLSKIGGFFLKVVGVLEKITPFAGLFAELFPVTGVAGIIGSDIAKAFNVITSVEATFQAGISATGNGPAKLKAASPQIGTIFTSVIDSLGLKISDETAASSAITNITSAMADLLNACEKK